MKYKTLKEVYEIIDKSCPTPKHKCHEYGCEACWQKFLVDMSEEELEKEVIT